MYLDDHSYLGPALPLSTSHKVVSAFGKKDARAHLDQAFTYFFSGNYDRVEASCRSAMSCECSEPDVRDGVDSLARILGFALASSICGAELA